MTTKWYPESSNIDWVKYDILKDLLTVSFCSGRTYEYYRVPSSVVLMLFSAESVGSFLVKNIVSKDYSYQEIEYDPEG